MIRDDPLLSSLAIFVGRRCQLGSGAVFADPALDLVGSPDLALREIGHRLGEVGAAGDLVCALSADSAQANADLMGADETDPGCSHGLS